MAAAEKSIIILAATSGFSDLILPGSKRIIGISIIRIVWIEKIWSLLFDNREISDSFLGRIDSLNLVLEAFISPFPFPPFRSFIDL